MNKVLITSLLSLSAFAVHAADMPTVSELATGKTTAAAFKEMVGKTTLPQWVVKGGVDSQGQNVTIDGVTYQLQTACKPHDCGAEKIAVLYSPKMQKMAGVLATSNESENKQTLQWLNISDELSIDGKTALFAALTGSADNHPGMFNFK
ncbi:Ivy family C-type lysozyme inhibitor [Enterobacter sp. 186315]